jgi:hypothetical protein
MKKNKKMSVGKKMMVGAGVAALAEGAYYLLGPKSKMHQKKASALVLKVKKEVKKDAKKLKTEWNIVSKKAVKKPVSKKKK